MSAARSSEWRQACGRVHARAKQLSLDDDARRDLQRRETGKESCAEMSAGELRRVLAAMNGRAGGRERAAPARTRGRRGGDKTRTGPLLTKLTALWISGYHLGVVRDRSDAGLARWFKRQSGLDAPAWAKPPQLAQVIEALQAWLARDGGVDWSPYIELGRDGEPRQVARPRARVLEAQWRILHRLGVVRIESTAALASYACEHAGLGRVDSHLALTDAQEIELMQYLGAKIRRARIKAVS